MVVFTYFLWFVHFVVCVGMIGIILVQADKTGGIQGAFGGGGSQVSFGAPGEATPIVKLTAYIAVGFMITSMILSYQSGTQARASHSVASVQSVDSIDLNLELPKAGEPGK